MPGWADSRCFLDLLVSAVSKPTSLNCGEAGSTYASPGSADQVHSYSIFPSTASSIPLAVVGDPGEIRFQDRVGSEQGLHRRCRILLCSRPWGKGKLLGGRLDLQKQQRAWAPSSSLLLLPPSFLGRCLAVLEYFQSNFVLLRV